MVLLEYSYMFSVTSSLLVSLIIKYLQKHSPCSMRRAAMAPQS